MTVRPEQLRREERPLGQTTFVVQDVKRGDAMGTAGRLGGPSAGSNGTSQRAAERTIFMATDVTTANGRT